MTLIKQMSADLARVTPSNSEATLRRARSDREVEMWAFRLEDSPSGFPLQVLGRITGLWAFRFNP